MPTSSSCRCPAAGCVAPGAASTRTVQRAAARSSAGCCEDAGRGVVTVDDALARIAEAKAQVQRVTTLLAGVEPRRGLRLPLEERVADAVAAAPRSPAGPPRAALEAAMAALRHTIRTTFLE